MRNLAGLLVIAATLGLVAPGASAAPPSPEAEAVGQALVQLCQPYVTPGASHDPEAFAGRVKGAGWTMEDPPGVYAFNRSGEWGRVRTAFSSEFDGGPCRIAVWGATGATSHDAAPALAAAQAWVDKGMTGASKLKDRAKAEKGPPGAVESVWQGAGLVLTVRELPPEGHRPAVQIDLRRIPS